MEGQESDNDSAEPEVLCCENGATTSLSSSFLNCTEITERAVAINTAQDGTVMMTMHVCLKTYYVRDRTGELRPITTKTFIVNKLKHDLLSGKCSTKQDIESFLMKNQRNLEFMLLMMGKYVHQNHSHS
jgi:hypothetical protein